MKFLLTNDDGVDAPGMHALFKCVARIVLPDDQVIVVAPDRQRSECGHSVTQGRSLKINQIQDCWFSVDGTPVDCVRVALSHLAVDADVVLSGVNQGANLGVDTMVSGTVAAAREASLHVPVAIALSHYRHPDVPKTWEHVPDWTEAILRRIIDRQTDGDKCSDIIRDSAFPRAGSLSNSQPMVWNVNLPATDPNILGHQEFPTIAECELDMNPHQRTPQIEGNHITLASNFQGRPRDAGSDVDRCFGGAITVTALKSNASSSQTFDALPID